MQIAFTENEGLDVKLENLNLELGFFLTTLGIIKNLFFSYAEWPL